EAAEQIQGPERFEGGLRFGFVDESDEIAVDRGISAPAKLEHGTTTHDTIKARREKVDQFLRGTFREISFFIDRLAPVGLEPVDTSARFVPVIDGPHMPETTVVPVRHVDRPVRPESG